MTTNNYESDNMHKSLEAVCVSLEEFSAAVTKAWAGEQTCNEAWGWNCPTLTRHDLAALPMRLASRIRESAAEEMDPVLLVQINDLPRRLQHMQVTTLPQLFSGNCVSASPAYIGTFESLERVLAPILAKKVSPEESWQVITDNKMMPSNLAKKIRSLSAEVAQITPDKDALAQQIKLIKEATDAAESLPTDLQALTEARNKTTNLANDSEKMFGKIETKFEDANKSVQRIVGFEEEATKLVAQCEEAYRITTSTGLAGAFDQRASQLQRSMIYWTVGLLAALAAGAYLGSLRVEILSASLSKPNPDWGFIWMHIVLSVLSIGAPLWFAWMATKQIGQRFRLSEDYAFKASVAKAYEGYRKEAARIDKAFEARLFNSALNRLEEAPLRFVENATHGSPWHELISSEAFQNAMATIPELKNTFIELAERGLSNFKRNEKVSSQASSPSPEPKPTPPPSSPKI